MNFKKLVLKIVCAISMTQLNLKIFDFDILLDEKSNENVLIYDISTKTLKGTKTLCIRFNKINVFFFFNL